MSLDALQLKLQANLNRQRAIMHRARGEDRDLSDAELAEVEDLQRKFDDLEPTLAAAVARERLRHPAAPASPQDRAPRAARVQGTRRADRRSPGSRATSRRG